MKLQSEESFSAFVLSHPITEALTKDISEKNEIDDEDIHLLELAPRLTLPSKSIDKWRTLVHLEAISVSSTWSSRRIEEMPIDQQMTFILPVARLDTDKDQRISSRKDATGNYATQLSRLLKSSGIYAFASLASPLVSLVLMPFLTRTLTRNDYGAFAVLNTAIALFAGLTQFGLGNAFFRAYTCDYEDKRDRQNVVSTVTILLSLISIPIAIGALITAPWLANILLNSASYAHEISLAALIVLLQNLTVPGLSWLRAENRAAFYSTLSIANLLVNLVGAILFVGYFHMGLIGALLATGSGYAVIVICTLPIILVRTGLHLRRDITQNLLSFGLPLVSNFVSVWILQLSDRYLLSHFASLSQTASYAVAYSLGGLLGVVILSPFSLAWPSAMFTIAKREDAPHVYRTVFRWYCIILLVSVFALSLASTFVFDFFFPITYHSAAPVIPIVALSIMLYAVYNYFNTAISIKRKTWFAVVFTTIAAVINVGFNLILIPRYGSMGAAWSTLLAYAVLTVVAYVVNQRIYFIPFEIDILIVGLAIGIILYVGSDFLAQGRGTYVGWSISLIALILFSLILALLGFLPMLRRKSRVQQSERSAVI